MPGRSLFLALIALLVCTTCTFAQTLSSSTGPSLSMKLRALETMNSTVGDSLAKSNQRIKQMTAYIDSKGLTDQWSAYTAPPEHLPQAMDFEEAYSIALKHEAAMGVADGENSQALGREVQAYTTMVKTVWGQYQDSMTTVARMSDFLNQQNEFDGYHSWAADQKQQKHDEMMSAAKEKAAEDRVKQAERDKEGRANRIAAKQKLQEHHEEVLKTAWQHYKFTSKQNLDYAVACQKYRHGYYNNYGDNYNDLYE